VEGARAGDWVELRLTLLEPGQRAASLPADTAATPYVARIRGFLESDAILGGLAAIETVLGRRVEGVLADPRPASTHSFGRPVEELLHAGSELRDRLAARGDAV
jgi:hypothetical protein